MIKLRSNISSEKVYLKEKSLKSDIEYYLNALHP